MTPKQAKIYDQVATQMLVEIEDKLSGTSDSMTINNILTSLLRLAQIANGHVVWDAKVEPQTGLEIAPKRVEPTDESNPKIDALIADILEDIENDPTGKTLVWSIFVPDILAIADALQNAGIGFRLMYGGVPQDKRSKYEEDYNTDPNVHVMVANPTVAGAGLNLVGYDWWETEPKCKTDTTNISWFGCNWSSIDRRQGEDRGHRKNTRRNVRIRDYVVPGTIDEEIRQRVQSKINMAMSVQDVREILKRL